MARPSDQSPNARPIYFGNEDPFGEIGDRNSIRGELDEIFKSNLRTGQLEVLTLATVSLAEEKDALEEGWQADRGWLFQLARRLQANLSVDERKGGGAFYAPFALFFIEEVSRRYELPMCDTDWTDQESVEIVFEACWLKVRFAEGEELVEECVKKAQREPCTRMVGLRGWVASTCYYLQEGGTGKSFFLAVNDSTAKHFRTSKVNFADCMRALEGRGFIKVLQPHIANRKARLFRFDTSHPDLLPSFRK